MPHTAAEGCPGRARLVAIPILAVLLGLAGCGESRTTRVVPVEPTRAASGEATPAPAATRPARAIATH